MVVDLENGPLEINKKMFIGELLIFQFNHFIYQKYGNKVTPELNDYH